MKRKLLFGVCAIGFVWACQSNDAANEPPTEPPIQLRLPGSSVADHCLPAMPITGGDLADLADRIVIGDVSSIEFVDELKKMDGSHAPSEGDCRPDGYVWTLKVRLDVSRNLKGTGESLEVFVTPEHLNWNSVPMRKSDGDWFPKYPDHSPAVELSDTLAWSQRGGIQVGQTLLLLAVEDQAGFSQTVAPWALKEDDKFTFQRNEIDCEHFPEILSVPFTEDDLVEELQTPSTQRFAAHVFARNMTTVVSSCITGEFLHEVIPESDAGL